jgi:hypothetical protein
MFGLQLYAVLDFACEQVGMMMASVEDKSAMEFIKSRVMSAKDAVSVIPITQDDLTRATGLMRDASEMLGRVLDGAGGLSCEIYSLGASTDQLLNAAVALAEAASYRIHSDKHRDGTLSEDDTDEEDQRGMGGMRIIRVDDPDGLPRDMPEAIRELFRNMLRRRGGND